MGQVTGIAGVITRTIRGWAAPRSALRVTTARPKRRKMRGMAAWSGAVHVGAPAKQHAAPHTAGIAKPQRRASVAGSSACLSAISGTTKCPISGELRP